MSGEKRYHQEKEISMKSVKNESDVETSHPSTSDARELGSTIATTVHMHSNDGLSEDDSNNTIHPNYQTDSYISMPPLYELKPEESSRERPNIQFRDLLKANALLQPYYWTCISSTRLGQRCRVWLPKKNIQLANREIMRLQADFPNDIPSETELVNLSKLLLCKKYHQSQAAEFALAWKKDLSVSSQQDTTIVDKDITPINISDKFVQFPSQQPNSIISAITAAMRKPPSPLDHQYGSIYIFARPETPSMIKIGATTRNVLHRLQQWSRSCHFDPNLISQHFVRHYLRTEKLIYCSLMEHRRHELSCNAGKGCNNSHREWFEVDSKHAISTVERWTRWMNLNPYVSNRLDAFWEINLFEAEQLPNLDAFHQWIEHMTQSCMEKGEESWRGRRDGHFKNRDENVADENVAAENVVDENVVDENVVDENVVDENVVDENVANEAQLSPVSSPFSIASTDAPSLVSGVTLSSTLSIDQLTSTVEKFVTWLLKDEVIQPLQVIAIDRIGAERFERNFRRFLQIYSKDLQAEARTPSELQAAQFVSKSGPIMASCLRRHINPVTKEDSRQFQTLSMQETDKDELMRRFGLSKTPMQRGAFNIDFDGFEDPGINPMVGNQSLNDIGWYDNKLDNIGLSDFDLDDIERDDSENDDADILSLPNLGLVREFMFTSESFAKLRQNLKHLIFPPRQHILEDLVEIETQKIDPTTDVAASPKIEADNRVAKLRVLKILKDSLSFYASGAMSYSWGYIAPTKLLPVGQVRLNWTCTCGHSSYDDFQELRPGAVAEYAQKLLQSGYVTYAQPTTQKSGSSTMLLAATKNQVAAVRRNISNWKTNKNGKNPKPKGRKFAAIQCSPMPGVTCRWLHICLKKRPNAKVTKLEPLHVCKDDEGKDLTDETLFNLLRKAWRIQRSWADLRLFKLTQVEFIKFSAVPDDSIDGIETGVVPPDTSHYDFTLPSPQDKVPPISPEHFVHLLEGECSANSQRGLFYFSKLPKKKDKPLKFSPTLATQAANVGYGLRFVEKPDPSIIATFLFLMTVLVGTSFGVSWTVFKQDLQGAWAISAYFVSVMALAMVTWQIRVSS